MCRALPFGRLSGGSEHPDRQREAVDLSFGRPDEADDGQDQRGYADHEQHGDADEDEAKRDTDDRVDQDAELEVQ